MVDLGTDLKSKISEHANGKSGLSLGPAKLGETHSVSLASSRKLGTFNELLERAQNGEAAAQTAVGQQYFSGIDVCRDYFKAVSWFRKAERLGDAEAKFCLSVCYINELGVEQDYRDFGPWYLRVLPLGMAYTAYARRLCLQSARQGYAQAQYAYGRWIMQGSNPYRARPWIAMAAKQGHAEAAQLLPELSAFGQICWTLGIIVFVFLFLLFCAFVSAD